ncbi:hypothetical protein [Candidatus Vidania fulgoroideorum]
MPIFFMNFYNFIKNNIKKSFYINNNSYLFYGERDFTKIKFALFFSNLINKNGEIRIFTCLKNYKYSKLFLNCYKKKLYICGKKINIKIIKKIINDYNKKRYNKNININIFYCIEDCNTILTNILLKIIEKSNDYFIFISFDINKVDKIISSRLLKIELNDDYLLNNLEFKKQSEKILKNKNNPHKVFSILKKINLIRIFLFYFIYYLAKNNYFYLSSILKNYVYSYKIDIFDLAIIIKLYS